MIDKANLAYAALDVPPVLERLFHPRPEEKSVGAGDLNLLIPVAAGVTVGARFHPAGLNAPTILFFHGNGEIAADYDDLAPAYHRLGANFLPVDYRGYGKSTGRPTVTAMMHDAYAVLDFAGRWLRENGYTGPLIVMGRSLGSAPALDLAAQRPELVQGLIVESGFAYTMPLLRVLGIDPETLGYSEENGVGNLAAMRRVVAPTLIIHGEKDQIIPFTDGQALFAACSAKDKSLLKISGANHNDLLWVGFSPYMAAVQALLAKAGGS